MSGAVLRARDTVVRRKAAIVIKGLLRVILIHYYFIRSPKRLVCCLAHSRYSIIFVEGKHEQIL